MYDDFPPDDVEFDPWDPHQVEIALRVAEAEHGDLVARLRAQIDDLTRENAGLRDELGRAHGLS